MIFTLAIFTWFTFVIASAVSHQILRRRALDKMSRKYVKVVDDSFNSINMTLSRIEKGMVEFHKDLVLVDKSVLALDKNVLLVSKMVLDRDVAQEYTDHNSLPVEPLLKKKEDIREENMQSFVNNISLLIDMFAKTDLEREALESIIKKVRNKYGK